MSRLTALRSRFVDAPDSLGAKARARRQPLVHTRPADRAGAVRSVAESELLGKTEMRHHFPDSEIHYEWMAGLVKALIAIRR
ncbi:hypothetical protein [Streptosporangium saharense]|uniref:hypothetical protein n=1 Tax=Streptosporangium saharense TaxID=1706840 RepID=UPI003333908C